MRVKILIYSHFFSPSIGGVETIVRSLAQGVAELRGAGDRHAFEVTLVTQTPAAQFGDGSLSFPVVRQPSLAKLWTLVGESDVVHLAGPAIAPLLAAFLAHKPVVVEHHGFQTICPNGQLLMEPLGEPCPGHFMMHHHGFCLRCNTNGDLFASSRRWLLTFVRRFLCSHASSNVVPTEWLGSQLHLPRTVCLAHGLETIAPVPGRACVDPPLVVFQGRLVSTKGVAVLLEAARMLKEERNRTIQVLIVGDGPERGTLERLAQEKGLSSGVRFAGAVPAAQLEEMISGARAIVVPSLAGEVFGLVVAENMLRAIPVIASDLGPFVEILGNAGVTFRKQDPVDLGNQIAKLLDDPGRAAQLAQRARQRALDYYPRSRMIEAHARLYESVVHR
jgi:glycosyltransferase involved in cell wall biosynthesis